MRPGIQRLASHGRRSWYVTTAVTVAALPLTLLALMGVRYFQAPLFVLGFALVLAAAVTLLVVAFSSPRDRGTNI